MSTTTPATFAAPVTLTMAQRFRVLHAAFFTPTATTDGAVRFGLPLMLWGDPGVAKTSIVRQLARAVGAAVEVFSPGERGEGAIGVVPVPAGDGYLDTPLPRWAAKFIDSDGYGLLALDELPTADARVQPGMMAAVMERTIGGVPFGGRTRVIAMGNPPDQTPGGHDLSLPLANRLVHLTWGHPTVEEWAGFMVGSGAADDPKQESSGPVRVADAAALEADVLRRWPGAFADAVGKVTSYLHAQPGKLHQMPDPGNTGASQAWPSPRSWDLATRALAGAALHGLSADETLALIAGCVGAAIAREFTVYAARLDLPPAEKVLNGEVQWDATNDRLDRVRAVLTGVTACMVSIPKADSRFNAYGPRFWALLLKVSEHTPDIALRFAREASQKDGVLAAGSKLGPEFLKSAAMQVMSRMTATGVAKVA